MGLNFFCFIPIFKYDIKVISFLTLWEGVEYCSGMIYQLKLKIVQSQKIYLKIWDVGPDHILLQNCKLKDMRYLIIRQYVMCGHAKIKESFCLKYQHEWNETSKIVWLGVMIMESYLRNKVRCLYQIWIKSLNWILSETRFGKHSETRREVFTTVIFFKQN